MSFDYLISLFVFCFVMAITPGPNNIMLMASGINYGVRRTIPHALGVWLGWPVMVLMVGLGLGQVFAAVPLALTILKFASAAYMLWLAWKVAMARPAADGQAAVGDPMTFMQAALFQWVNGKAWFMAVSTIGAFTLAQAYASSVAAIVTAYMLVGVVSISAWVLFGAGLRALLTDPRWYRWINLALALALVVSLWPMLRQ
jgi:threonine/homoserine/homoserine lactone efflux protein